MGELELGTLAGRINEEYRLCEQASHAAVTHAMNCGDLLREAKSKVPHGQWGTWLRNNFEGSDRTARLYMQMSENRPAIEAKRQRVAVLGLREAVRAISPPKTTDLLREDVKKVLELYEAAKDLDYDDQNIDQLEAGILKNLWHNEARIYDAVNRFDADAIAYIAAGLGETPDTLYRWAINHAQRPAHDRKLIEQHLSETIAREQAEQAAG